MGRTGCEEVLGTAGHFVDPVAWAKSWPGWHGAAGALVAMTDTTGCFDVSQTLATKTTADAEAGGALGPTEEAQGESTRVEARWARDGRFHSGSGARPRRGLQG